MKKFVLLLSFMLCASWSFADQNDFVVTDDSFVKLDLVTYVETMSFSGQYIIGGAGKGFLWDLKINTHVEINPLIDETSVEVSGVNSSGIVVGNFRDPNTLIELQDINGNSLGSGPVMMAGIWRNGTWEALGLGTLLAENLHSGDFGSIATCISEDGKTIGGNLSDWNPARTSGWLYPGVWKYNEETSKWDFTAYSFPTESSVQGSKISRMSADGSIVAGWTTTASGDRYPIIWTSPTEYTVIKGEGGTSENGFSWISANGKYGSFTFGSKACLYNVEEGTFVAVSGHTGAGSYAGTCVTDNGLLLGYSNFGNMFTGQWRTAFVYSEAVGVVDFKDFLSTFAPNMVFPAGVDFSPTTKDFKVPMAISRDGKVVSGWMGANTLFRNPWALTIANNIVLLNKPSNLVASVANRNQVTLAWEAPVVDPENELKGYKVLRNGEEIASTQANELTYIDSDAPAGKVAYSIAAYYEAGTSIPCDNVNVSVVDSYDIPFFEDFESTSFDTNYWTIPTSSKWALSLFAKKGINSLGAGFSAWDASYDEALTSKPLDATGLDKVYLTFGLRSELTMGATFDYKDKFTVEALVDGTWIVLKEYSGKREESKYNSELIDLSDAVKGKLFQLRFRVTGESDSRGWCVDNIHVNSEYLSGNAPNDILGLIPVVGDDQSTLLTWKNPSGAYELSYESTSIDAGSATGNGGVPFIAAIEFDADKIALHKDQLLSSVSVFINQDVAETTVPYQLSLMLFDGDTKIEQSIPFYVANEWNVFALDTPILIDGTKAIKVGVNVLSHAEFELPIGCDGTQTVGDFDGKGNLFSEDGGVTWQKLSDFLLPYVNTPMPYLWSIIANVTSPDDLVIPIKDENLAGYNIYRNGEKLNDGFIYNPRYIETTPTVGDKYIVEAYYVHDGFLTPQSKEFILQSGSVKICDSDKVATISVYPNPATNYIHINGEFTSARLFSATGQTIAVSAENNIDVQSLPNAVYYLEVVTEQGTVTQKIIVNNKRR